MFVDEILCTPDNRPNTVNAFCHDYWTRTPLDTTAALEFADRLGPAAVGMMITSRSNTPDSVRLAATARCAEITGEPHTGR